MLLEKELSQLYSPSFGLNAWHPHIRMAEGLVEISKFVSFFRVIYPKANYSKFQVFEVEADFASDCN
jgi:hypothetical protein